MKNAAVHIKRFKKLLATLRKETPHRGKDEIPEDPIEQLLLGLLARAASEHRAAAGLAALRGTSVDLNELRVTSVAEMVETLGVDFPQGRQAADSLARALNAIFNKTHALSLANLKSMGVKAAGSYLSNLDGVDPHARALVLHYCLKGHAVPLDENMFSYMRRTGCVPPESTHDEAQAFLERQLKQNEIDWFYHTFKRYAATHAGRPEKPAKPAADPAVKKAPAAKKAASPAKSAKSSPAKARPKSAGSASKSARKSSGKRAERHR